MRSQTPHCSQRVLAQRRIPFTYVRTTVCIIRKVFSVTSGKHVYIYVYSANHRFRKFADKIMLIADLRHTFSEKNAPAPRPGLKAACLDSLTNCTGWLSRSTKNVTSMFLKRPRKNKRLNEFHNLVSSSAAFQRLPKKTSKSKNPGKCDL